MPNYIPFQSLAGRLGSGVGDVLGNIGKGISQEHYSTQDVLKQLERKKIAKIFAPYASSEEQEALSLAPDNQFYAALNSGFGSQNQENVNQNSALEFLNNLASPEQKQQIQSASPQQKEQLLQVVQQSPKFQEFVQQKQQEQQPIATRLPVTKAKSSPFVGDLKVEAQNLRKQQAIQKKNAPFIKESRTLYDQSQDVKRDAQDLINIIDNGKLHTSFGGVLPKFVTGLASEQLPSWLSPLILNKEEQEYTTKLNDLIDRLGSVGKGVPTKFRLQLKKAAKPNLGQDIDTQKKILEDLIAKSEEDSLPYIKSQEYIDQYGQEPDNLETLVFKSLNLPAQKKEAKESSLKSGEKINKVSPDIVNKMEEGGFLYANGKPVYQKKNGKLIKV